jgi:hypothetical protein
VSETSLSTITHLDVVPPLNVVFTRAAFTRAEWAEMCGLSLTTIKQHVAAGRLPECEATEAGGKKIITLEDGLQWLRELPRTEVGRRAS